MARGMDGFDGQQFAAGSVTGVRWWNLGDRTGLLHGVQAAWKPGENTAACTAVSYRTAWDGPHGPVPDPGCGCGYWAYWAMENHEAISRQGRPVVGVVEGYGDVLIGPKGFRAAKAKVVALCTRFVVERVDPDWKPPTEQQALARARRRVAAAEGLFRRGPGGLDTFAAMTGARKPEEPPMVPDLAEQARIEAELAERYACPVYASPKFMLSEHPPSEGYAPHDERCRCDKCLQPLQDAIDEVVRAVQSGSASAAVAAVAISDLLRCVAGAQASGADVSAQIAAASNWIQQHYGSGQGSINWGVGGGGSASPYASGGGGGSGGGSSPYAYGSSGACAHPAGLVCSNCNPTAWVAPARLCCVSLDGQPHAAGCPANDCPYCGAPLGQGRHDAMGCS